MKVNWKKDMKKWSVVIRDHLIAQREYYINYFTSAPKDDGDYYVSVLCVSVAHSTHRERKFKALRAV